ncbi:C-terminal binding protein [Lysinibacter cavernae]|nr:C-terminal binding protein [Lysinibacter cavernae]
MFGNASSGQRPLIVFTDQTDLDPVPGRRLLEAAGFDTMLLSLMTERDVPAEARRAVGLVVGYASIDQDIFDAFPDLAIIATTSAGFDMVDVEVAERRGIWVCNLVDAATQEVAAHALALILATERELRAATSVTANGGWTDDVSVVPRRLSELTLGLFGFGRIARQLATIASPLFGKIVAYDPYCDAYPAHVEGVSFGELLTQSNVLSLHSPLTDDTRGIINTAAFAKLQMGATLINVSRGELVDQDALIEALDSGRLRGAGLDVLDAEPPSADHPLRRHPKAIVTPHIGFLSDASLQHYVLDPSRTIIDWAQTGAPARFVVRGSR